MICKEIAKLLLGTLLGLTACAGMDTQADFANFARGPEVPVVRLLDLAGNERSLQEFKGRPFILTFWAPWCMLCMGEMPSLAKLRSDFKDDPLEIVAVAIDSTQKEVERAVVKYKLPFTVLLDLDYEAKHALEVDAIPISFVVDKGGQIVEFPDPSTGFPMQRIEGPRDWSGYQTVRAVETLRAE